MNSTKKVDFFGKLIPMSNEEHKQIDNDRLVVYAVNLLESKGLEPTFDSIVVTVFRLFPDRFSLIGFSQYPDAKRVHDCLWHCTYKTKKWINGNTKSGFRLSNKGRYVLEETFKRMKGLIKTGKIFNKKARRKEIFFLDWIKTTGAFSKFTDGKANCITEVEVREFLRVSNDASKTVMLSNLDRYKDYARKIHDTLVEEFLNFIRDKWRKLFE